MDMSTKSFNARRWLLYAFLLACSIVFLFPLYLSIVASLQKWMSVPSVLPNGFYWSNYRDAVTMIDFWKFAQNSVVLCVIGLVTTTLTSGLVGYAFARIKAPGRKGLFLIVLSTMMLPGIVTQIPTYVLFHRFNLLDTYWPWVFWGLGGNAFFIFLYRQFFSAIPKELEEAARIDGCSIFRTYWNIFLPLSLPVMATVSIMNFQGAWGDFMTPFMFLKVDHYPLATALSMIGYQLEGTPITIQQVAVAGANLFMIPVLLVFFLGQRYLIEGIVTTGVKG
ncbi:carbohydrate ABC transporter permease [Paenibacillus sp. PAMC21692]|nr:carbohydrate ABC transporter permease [Paenibacillus sp. PAMC21692]